MSDKTVFLAGPSGQGKHNIEAGCHGLIHDYWKYIRQLATCLSQVAAIGFVLDEGLPLDVAKRLSGPNEDSRPKRIGFAPRKRHGEIKFAEHCDSLVMLSGGWSAVNTQPSKNFDILLCCGLSAGVLTEISYVKVHRLYGASHTTAIVDRRTVSGTLPAELEDDLGGVGAGICYVDSWEDLEAVLA